MWRDCTLAPTTGLQKKEHSQSKSAKFKIYNLPRLPCSGTVREHTGSSRHTSLCRKCSTSLSGFRMSNFRWAYSVGSEALVSFSSLSNHSSLLSLSIYCMHLNLCPKQLSLRARLLCPCCTSFHPVPFRQSPQSAFVAPVSSWAGSRLRSPLPAAGMETPRNRCSGI